MKPGHTRGCQSMPNVSIPGTDTIKLVMGTSGEENKPTFQET